MLATPRIGANIRSWAKSNGLATAAIELTGRSGRGGQREQRHDPAQAPADDLHGLAAGVLGDRRDRARQHVLHPVLEPEVAVRERDRPVVHHVGRVPEPEEVLGHRAAAAQVEADRRRGQRRDQQHGQVARALLRREVLEDRALRLLVDDPRRRAAQVGDTAPHEHVEGVGRGVDDVVGRGEQRQREHRRARHCGGSARSVRRERRREVLQRGEEALGRLDLRAVPDAVQQRVGACRAARRGCAARPRG